MNTFTAMMISLVDCMNESVCKLWNESLASACTGLYQSVITQKHSRAQYLLFKHTKMFDLQNSQEL